MPKNLSKNAIIVFAKTPQKGKVKTRLAKETSNTFAIGFYESCLQYLFNMLSENEWDTLLYLTPDSDPDYFSKFGALEIYFQIEEGDLGKRMETALNDQLENYEKVLLIGSDIPSITNEHLSMGLNALDQNDAVIGPSLDGGYYLIGFRNGRLTHCFDGIEWSKSSVLHETLSKFKTNPPFLLPYCRDVDTLSDLQVLYHEESELPASIKAFCSNYPEWF